MISSQGQQVNAGAVHLWYASGSSIARNIIDVQTQSGIELGFRTDRNQVIDNVIKSVTHTNGAGVSVVGPSNGNVIGGNRVSGFLIGIYCFGGTGDGPCRYNLFERNLLTNNEKGLQLHPNCFDNVYRGNVARGNSERDFWDMGGANTSGDDNFMPNKM